MQKLFPRLIVFVYTLFLTVCVLGAQSKGVVTSKIEQEHVERWVKRYLINHAVPFFSFVYNGRESPSFLAEWKVELTEEKMDKVTSGYTLTFTDPKTMLIVRCKAMVYADFPAIEWMLEFENTGNDDTPIIEEIQAADIRLFASEHERYILYHALGSNHGENDFAPLRDIIKADSEITLAPKGGRSSDETALPFFNIQAEDEGTMVGVGWTGQWQAW